MSTIGSYSVLPPQRRFHLHLPLVIALSVVAVLILLAALYYLSIPQLVLVSVAGVLLMALFYRISCIQSFSESCSADNLDCSDGGAFSINETTAVSKQAKPVVSDGGSFERVSGSKIQ